jgi:hypothetical protein
MKSVAAASFFALVGAAAVSRFVPPLLPLETPLTGPSHPQAASLTVPSGISAQCSSYLTQLDSSSTLSSCTAALTSATTKFANGATGVSASDVSSALSSLCSPTVASTCSESTFRPVLSAFYSACTAELTSSPNTEVILMYDTIYGLVPFRNAMCVKDDSGAFCKGASSSAAASVQKVLGSTAAGVSFPNPAAWASSNIAYLFLTSPVTSAQCDTCTKGVLTAYTSFEADQSYAPGLGASVLFKGQTALYQSVNSVCTSSFLSGSVQAAGGIGNSVVGSANSAAGLATTGPLAAAFAALAAGAAVALF